MKILVTGGLGFIGSHTVISLLAADHEVYIVDNLSNARIEVLDTLKIITGNKLIPFEKVDVTDEVAINRIFSEQKFDGVIHFAGFKAVGESVSIPLSYYKNNVLSTIVLLEACIKNGVKRFVFSSSATVYGDNKVPFKEEMKLLPTTNPYGESKAISERILKDTSKAYSQFSISVLRYFNPVGAHKSGLIGESPKGTPNNLMPYINQTAKGIRKKLNIFGGDYPTKDGTGVRDFIHVMDIAEGHVAALENVRNGLHIYNLGTGCGVSVMDLITTYTRVNKVEIPYNIVERRAGDIASSYADTTKAEKELGWKAKRTVEQMCRDAWNYEKNNTY